MSNDSSISKSRTKSCNGGSSLIYTDESRSSTDEANLTKKTVFSFRGGIQHIDGDKEPAGPPAVGGTCSPSSRATECAVTRAGKPAPSRIPAIIPDKYASTDKPPKSDGTLIKVLHSNQLEKEKVETKAIVESDSFRVTVVFCCLPGNGCIIDNHKLIGMINTSFQGIGRLLKERFPHLRTNEL